MDLLHPLPKLAGPSIDVEELLHFVAANWEGVWKVRNDARHGIAIPPWEDLFKQINLSAQTYWFASLRRGTRNLVKFVDKWEPPLLAGTNSMLMLRFITTWLGLLVSCGTISGNLWVPRCPLVGSPLFLRQNFMLSFLHFKLERISNLVSSSSKVLLLG